MSSDALKDKRRSPLAGVTVPEWEGEEPQVMLQEIPFTGKFIVRALEPLPTLNESLNPVLGFDLPDAPNARIAGSEVAAIWLRENQWMVTCPAAQVDELFGQIDAALTDTHNSIVDVSDYYTIIRLSGAKARDVLQKGCPLDMHPRVFPAGAVAQTRLGHADILLHYGGDDNGAPSFGVMVRATFAEYVWRWLHDAALEYGVTVK